MTPAERAKMEEDLLRAAGGTPLYGPPPPPPPEFDPAAFRQQAAERGFDMGKDFTAAEARGTQSVAERERALLSSANAHQAPKRQDYAGGMAFEQVNDVPKPPPTGAEARVEGAKDMAREDVSTQPVEARVPRTYDAVTDATAATRVAPAVGGAVVQVGSGGFQPERVTTQQESGVPIPEDVTTLTRQGYEARQSAAETMRGAGERAAMTEGIGAVERAKGDREFMDQENQARAAEGERRASALKRVQDALDKMDEPIETPHDRMQKWDIGKKIGFVLASMLGGAAGYKTNTNPFLESFNKFAEQDMEAQRMKRGQAKDRLAGAQSLYDLVRQNVQSDGEARAAVRALYWKSFASTMEAQAARLGIDLNDAKYQDMRAAVDEKYSQTLMEYQKLSAGKTTVQKSVKYVPPQFVSLGAKQTGLKPEDVNKRLGEYIDFREKAGQPLREAALDQMRRALEALPPGLKGKMQEYLATNRGDTYAALRTMWSSGDPQAKEALNAMATAFVDIARADGGKTLPKDEIEIQKMRTDPGNFVNFYGSTANQYNQVEGDARLKLGLEGPQLMPIVDRLRDWHRNAPGTTSRAVGANVLEGAMPKPQY